MNKLLNVLLFLLMACEVNCQSPGKGKGDGLDNLTAAVSSKNYTDIHSISISQHGKLKYEKYFNGWTKDSLHDLRSAYKSITSLLTGIAIDQGLIKDVNQKVYSYFPEFSDFKGNNSWKREITIEDLLRMKSGFDCEEFDGEKDCETDMMGSEDWVRFSLNLPMKYKPGTVWAYMSSNPMILSGIISRVAKMPIMEFARKHLFEPLGITHYKWTVDPAGYGMTAGSFYMQPADFLKIGEMMINKGIWNGKRIVSEAWLEQSTETPVLISDFSFAKSSKSDFIIPQSTHYGYYWYREEIRTETLSENVLILLEMVANI